jgi:hypothetical protein
MRKGEGSITERRSLTEGLKTAVRSAADPEKEKAFVYGQKDAAAPGPDAPLPASIRTAATVHSRVPVSTRLRADFAAALKRASLERQLSGTSPNTLQDILEEAIEPWLQENGYIS